MNIDLNEIPLSLIKEITVQLLDYLQHKDGEICIFCENCKSLSEVDSNNRPVSMNGNAIQISGGRES